MRRRWRSPRPDEADARRDGLRDARTLLAPRPDAALRGEPDRCGGRARGLRVGGPGPAGLGAGLALLRAAGIEVVVGIGAEAARRDISATSSA